MTLISSKSIKELISQPRAVRYRHSMSLSGFTIHQNAVSTSRMTGSKSVILTHNAILQKKENSSHGKDHQNPKDNLPISQRRCVSTISRKGITQPVTDTSIKKRSLNKPVIRQRITAFISAQKSKKSMYFWTVTFPEKTSDTYCYKALNSFLTSLRLNYESFEYLWVAERQINGTIHYHIAIPNYVSIVYANKVMKYVLSLYIKQQKIDYSLSQISNYNGVHISKHPTTNKAINFAVSKKGKSLSNYLTKYITKNETTSDHSVWHCSRVFSSLMLRLWLTESESELLLTNYFSTKEATISTDEYQFYKWTNAPPPSLNYILSEANHAIMKHKLYSQCNYSVGLSIR